MRRLSLHPVPLLLGLTLPACYTPPARTVQRVDPKSTIDLSGEWNDADANRVAESMIRDMLGRPWAEQFRQQNGRDPVVKLYPIKNRSQDHINTKFFSKQIEKEMINSGRIQVVAGWDETGDARDERVDQSYHASDATKKEHQQETGTDFILNGWILAHNDRTGGQTVRAYMVTMELINAESQRKVWLNTTPIKKVINQAEYQW